MAVRPRYLAAAIVIAEDTIVATAAADDDDDKYNPKTRITAKEIVSAHIMNSILPLRDGYNLLLFFGDLSYSAQNLIRVHCLSKERCFANRL